MASKEMATEKEQERVADEFGFEMAPTIGPRGDIIGYHYVRKSGRMVAMDLREHLGERLEWEERERLIR